LEQADRLPPGASEPLAGARPRKWLWFIGAAGLALLLGGCALWAWPESAVMLESSPPGAEVSLDGRPAGRTPLRLASRPLPLQDRVAVRLKGYRDWSGALTASPGETRRVELQLETLPGSVSLSSVPPGALVTLDQQETGRTPLVLSELAPGQHELALSLADYEVWETSLEVEPGQSVAQEVSLVRRPKRESESASLATGVSTDLGWDPTEPGKRSLSSAAPLVEQLPAIPQDPTKPLHPLAVMVENAPDARPQSGLGSADIIFEAMAEGGISRFMAVYVDGDAAVVGPVRSARHYFVNLAAELGASVVHVGASPLGYVSITWYGLQSLDETFAQPGFWRSRARFAPHNAYTSVQGARAALDSRGPLPNGSWAGFSFKDPARAYQGPPTAAVALDYQPWGYHVEYRYDAASNRYARFMEGAPHVDAESHVQLQAANVVVLSVNAWVIDAAGRLDMAQVGNGPAVFFEDGVAIDGSWSKATTGAATQFQDRSGNSVHFNPGPIWVQLIAPEGKVSY
jgi:hypothetical protein